MATSRFMMLFGEWMLRTIWNIILGLPDGCVMVLTTRFSDGAVWGDHIKPRVRRACGGKPLQRRGRPLT